MKTAAIIITALAFAAVVSVAAQAGSTPTPEADNQQHKAPETAAPANQPETAPPATAPPANNEAPANQPQTSPPANQPSNTQPPNNQQPGTVVPADPNNNNAWTQPMQTPSAGSSAHDPNAPTVNAGDTNDDGARAGASEGSSSMASAASVGSESGSGSSSAVDVPDRKSKHKTSNAGPLSLAGVAVLAVAATMTYFAY